MSQEAAAEWFRPGIFPADRGRLLDFVQVDEAPASVIDAIVRLPPGTWYGSSRQLASELARIASSRPAA